MRDIERSLTFYTPVLGYEIKKRRDDLKMVSLSAGKSIIDLVDAVGTIGGEGGPAAGKQRHNGKGAIMRHGAEGEGLSIYCFDPDGNQIKPKGPAFQP